MSALLNPLTCVLINAAVIVLVKQGAIRVNAGALTTGAVVALYNYMSQILVELVKFASLVITINKAWASWKRIEDALALEPSITAPATMAARPDPAAPAVEFRHVGLTYPGAGKSSIAGLIPRFYEATGGAVLVEGVDVRQWPRAELRRRVGFVMQKASLFKGTIRENLLWGRDDATDAELLGLPTCWRPRAAWTGRSARTAATSPAGRSSA